MSDTARSLHKSEWRLNQVTDELNARPFPRFGLPTAIFRLCLAGPQAFDSLRKILAEPLNDVDWHSEAQARLVRARRDGVQYNIERHTEFISLTIIDDKADELSPARHLPEDWLSHIDAEIVVAVDCHCAARGEGTGRESWVCASRLEGGLADVFFDFKVAEDGHTKIAVDFDAAADVRDIGRIALQVVEIETYRSFAAIGLPQARQAQAELADIAARVPDEGAALAPDEAGDQAAAERFTGLSALAGELERIWRETSFRFSACEAYWALVQARLASLNETAFDNRITVSGFLQRRLAPAIATYLSTEKRRHDLADQVGNMTALLQTRIELGLQRQNADLLASLNSAAARQLRLQHTVEGVSTVAISYYLVNLLNYPLAWLLARAPNIEPVIAQSALVAAIIPLVWLAIRRLLRATISR